MLNRVFKGHCGTPLNKTLDGTMGAVAEYTKKERSVLRELAGEAYERELGQHLAKLDKSFAAWRRGELVSSELSKEIHEFHQHAAREVWSAHQLPNVSMIVARALALKILKPSDVPAELRIKLKDQVALYE